MGVTIEVRSAGTAAASGDPIAADAERVLSERDINASSHRSAQVDQDDMDWADLVLTMTQHHKEILDEMFPDAVAAGKVYTLAGYAGSSGDIADPIGQGLEAYRQTAAELEHFIRIIVQKWRRSS